MWICPSGKEKPATGLKMGKTKKTGENPANPEKQSYKWNEKVFDTKILIFQSLYIQPPLFLYAGSC